MHQFFTRTRGALAKVALLLVTGFSLLVAPSQLLAQGGFIKGGLTKDSEDYLAGVGSVSRVIKGEAGNAVEGAIQRSVSSQMRSVWRDANENNKVVMMVLGADNCDRCELLDKYMRDEVLKARIDRHFVVLNLGVDALGDSVAVDIKSQHLPAIVLVESANDYQGLLPSEQMLTFMPEPHEPLYDWMDSLLFYSDQVFSASTESALRLTDS